MTAQIIPFIPQDAITLNHNQVRTNSLKVAEAFGKLHKNVIRKLETIECSPEFNQLNFEPVEYKDAKGEKRTLWEMTKDGFMFLVMGFTGKKAASVKEAYINAFNAMAEQLRLPASDLKTKTALPNGLTLEQCDAVKALVKARAESCPKELRAAATIKCWSAIKSKFGCSYKEIAPEHFVDALGLVARIELEGEYLPAGTPELPPINAGECMKIDSSVPVQSLNLPQDVTSAIEKKAFSLAQEAFNLSIDHLYQRVAYMHGPSLKSGKVSSAKVIATINEGDLGQALTYALHRKLEWIANSAYATKHLAADLEAEIRSTISKPGLQAAS